LFGIVVVLAQLALEPGLLVQGSQVLGPLAQVFPFSF